MNHDENVLYF
ncbi:Protein of unknown function [Bacillus mycoides]|nr:Protein of unknown function [Bacillus mycoides]